MTILTTTLVLWLLFVNVSTTNPKSVLFKPLLIIAYIYDVIYNFTVGTVIFMELPSFGRPTLSMRLRYIIMNREGWRFKQAIFFCKYLIEPWQPGHCRLPE